MESAEQVEERIEARPLAEGSPTHTRERTRQYAAQHMDTSSHVGSAPTPSVSARMQDGDSLATSTKRGLDQLSSGERSPPARRIKIEPIDSDLTPVSTTMPKRLTTTAIGSAFVVDPLNNDNYWQILCTGTKLGRRKLCFYLGFKDVKEMEDWEDSEPEMWNFINVWISIGFKEVELVDVLRVICNDGGVEAEILSWLERQRKWELANGPAFNEVVVKCQESAQCMDTPTAEATLHMASIIVWLIRKTNIHFLESGLYGSKVFWYAPEDVNRAFWYLWNLLFCEHERNTGKTQSAKSVNFYPNPDRGTLHSSLSTGKWTRRLLPKSVVQRDAKKKDVQAGHNKSLGRDPVSSSRPSASQTPALGKPRYNISSSHQSSNEVRSPGRAMGRAPASQAPNRPLSLPLAPSKKELMKEQLISLRTWAYGMLGGAYPSADEKKLDALMNAARLHIKSEAMTEFDQARLEVRMFILDKKLPANLSDDGKMMLRDFRALLSTTQTVSNFDLDAEDIGAVLEEAVMAIGTDQRAVYNRKKSEIKEMAYSVEYDV